MNGRKSCFGHLRQIEDTPFEKAPVMACFMDADGVAIGIIKYGGKETIIVK